MARRFLLLLAVLSSLLTVTPALAQSAPTCQYILGFATLHALDPIDTGACVDNQAFAANGDAQQHTTNGLMAWRKLDDWTAFTNGYWTWINGPAGLAKRLNTQRFSWEANPEQLPIAPTTFIYDSRYHGGVVSLTIQWDPKTGVVAGTLAHAMPAPDNPIPNIYSFPLVGTTDGHTFHFAPASIVFSEQDQGLVTATGQFSGQQFSFAVVRPNGTGYTLPLVETTPESVTAAEQAMAATCSKHSSTALPADVIGPGGFCFT